MEDHERPPSYARSVEWPTPIILKIYRLKSISPPSSSICKIGRHAETLKEAILLSPSVTWEDFGSDQVGHAADLFQWHEKFDVDTTLAWSVIVRGERKRDKIVHEDNWEQVKKLMIASREELVMTKKPELILVVGPVLKEESLVKKAWLKGLDVKRKVFGYPWA
ncbi:Hypothetical predicted protein [Lecanosticta acicola]|uniref:Uncharacterized protein n=1 Tax=Lecanosticta acicola TaxID=111012 RepID=A0AAI8Z259_9PEZI|nr:Hypothetical predicted protein [Lecanosticta acicola]